MKKLLTLFAVVIYTAVGAQTPDKAFPTVGGSISAMYKDGPNNVLYVGGNFQWVGPHVPNAAVVDNATGLPDFNFPSPNDFVYTALPDGNGGFYMGGKFTSAGGQVRNRAAHVDATGNVTAWNPDVDGTVLDMTMSGSTIYLAGTFHNVGGQVRNGLAAVDMVTGAVSTWDPAPNQGVTDILVNGSSLFAIGGFTNIGGQARNQLAEVNLSTGNATSFDATIPPANTVSCMAISGSTLYVGGNFNTIGGQTRTKFASLNIATGVANAFNPGSDGHVTRMLISGTTMYLLGSFNVFAGQPRVATAAIDLSTETLKSWTLSGTNAISMAIDGNTLYMCGDFTALGGQPRNNVAAVDATTGQVLPWNPNADERVNCILPLGNKVFLGGQFLSLGRRECRHLAAIDCNTRMPIAWDPAPQITGIGGVFALAKTGNTVYVGGLFSSIGGQPRINLAAVDATTGLATGFAPNPSKPSSTGIRAIALYNGMVYAGGSFTAIGGQTITGIAQLDAATGNATSWNANVNTDVNIIKPHNNTLYIGGPFEFVGGQVRNNIAALDPATAAVTAWDPKPMPVVAGTISAFSIDGNSMYVGGDYSSIGGQLRNGLAKIDLATGAADAAWDAQLLPTNTVRSVVNSQDHVFIGGTFTLPGAAGINNLGTVSAVNGSPMTWQPAATFTVSNIRSLLLGDSRLYVAGGFSSTSGYERFSLGAYLLPPGLNVNNNQVINAEALTIYPNPITGGQFTCTFSSTKTETTELTITDITGKVLHTQKVNVVNGKNTVHVNAAHIAGNQLLMVNMEGVAVGKVMVK